MAVTGVATTSRLERPLSNVTYSPSHHRAGSPVINIQSAIRTAPDMCKNVSLAVLFDSNGNSYTVATQSQKVEKLVGPKERKKLGQQ